MLTALEEFITNVRVDKTGEVVSMLEYLHSQYPAVGDGKEYAKLLVDMKTKVLYVFVYNNRGSPNSKYFVYSRLGEYCLIEAR